MNIALATVLTFILYSTHLYAATKHDSHLPINHCYHWLNDNSKGYLSFKYTYAKSNGNELTFITSSATSNGNVAGPGLYCGKAPTDSFSYGDRVIRVQFVPDVVLYDDLNKIQYCGMDGETNKNSAQCAGKTWDVKFFNGGGIGNYAWYVIQNPMAIESWSANSDQVIEDLNVNKSLDTPEFKTHAENTITTINQERRIMGEQIFYNDSARFSIIDLVLKNPAQLDSIPPLNIVTRVHSDSSNRLTEIERTDLYKKFIQRSLLSYETEFSEIEILAKKDQKLATIINNAVLTGLKDPSKQNAFIMLGTIAKNPDAFKGVSDKVLRSLIESVLKNSSYLTQFSQSSIQLQGPLKAIALSVLDEKSKGTFDLEDPAFLLIPTVLEKFSNKEERHSIKQKWLKNIFSNKKEIYGLQIDNKSFYMESVTKVEEKCMAAVALSDENDTKVFKLKYREQDIEFGNIADTISAQKKCQEITSTIQILLKLNPPKKYSKLHIVKGRMETSPFIFIGHVLEDINEQCSSFYPSVPNPSHIDEIYISLNSGDESRLYNSDSYWKTETSVCGQVTTFSNVSIPTREELQFRAQREVLNAHARDLKAKSTTGFIVEGRMEQSNFVLFSHDLEGIKSQCLELHQYIPNKSYVDEIYWSANSSTEERLYNSDSYWKTGDTVCEALINALKLIVPTKEALKNKLLRDGLNAKWAAYKTKSTSGFDVTGRIENYTFAFFGKHQEEILDQCREFYTYVESKDHVDEIYVKFNTPSEVLHYHKQSYWKTEAEVCGKIQESITEMPTKEELSTEIERNTLIQRSKELELNSGNNGHKVHGHIEKYPFYFFGLNHEQIMEQCSDFYKHVPAKQTVDYISVSVDHSSLKRLSKSRGYWTTESEVCGQIADAIRGQVLTIQEIVLKRQLEEKKLAFNQFVQNEYETYSQVNFPYKVSGSLGSYQFYFYGDNFENIITQCNSYISAIPVEEFSNKIDLSINESRPREMEYSRPATKLCNWLRPELSLKVPASDEVEFERENRSLKPEFESSNAPYKALMKIQNRYFYFFGSYLEEVKKQCIEFYSGSNLNTTSLDVIYSVNDQTNKLAKIENSSGANIKFCKQVEGLLKADIPSLVNVNNMNKNNKLLLTITGHLGEVPFELAGYSIKDLKKQCRSIYSKLLKENKNSSNPDLFMTYMSWSVNGSAIFSFEDELKVPEKKSFFSKKTKRCDDFTRHFEQEFQR